jgi:hypothetical protein
MRKLLLGVAVLVLCGGTTYFFVGGNVEQKIENTSPDTETSESVVADLIACNKSTTCMTEILQPYAVEVGPEAAIQAVKEAGSIDTGSDYTCHTLYEFIARAVTEANGIVDYHNSECQFGYTHGVLYAMGETYDDIETLITDALEYCAGYIRDPNAMNSPDSACHHGLGHALADVTYDDPLAAVVACERAFQEYYGGAEENVVGAIESCGDGVFMQYGDNNLVRVGFSVPGVDGLGTSIKPEDILGVCRSLDEVLGMSCYARLWKFIGPGVSSRSKTAEACLEAKSERAIDRCYQGFGELFAWETNRNWPPDTAAQADEFAERTARECEQYARVLSCLHGVLGSTNSHLYAIDYDPELIPDPCAYVATKYTEECYARDKEARRINWDKTEGLDNGEDTAKSGEVG